MQVQIPEKRGVDGVLSVSSGRHNDVPTVTSIAGDLILEDGTAVLRYNPSRPDEVTCRVVNATREFASQAVQIAADSFSGWSLRAAGDRAEVLRRAADLLDERVNDIARDLAREEGKTFAEGAVETRRAAEILRFSAAQAGYEPYGSMMPSTQQDNLLLAYRVPLGAIAVITPWNFPIAIPAWKIGPALAFGNTVVWKPAEITPLTSRHLFRALDDAGLDKGALVLLVGSGRTVGPVITEHPAVRAVTFTGSTPVGRGLMATVGPLGKPLQLEMGGKNAAVVLEDADIVVSARAIANAGFLSSGQKCTATSRVIVVGAAYEPLLERLASHADEFVLGDPLLETTDLGPVSSPGQAQTVRDLLAEGLRDGRLVTSRDPDDYAGSNFVPPVVLADLPVDSRVVREEVFGPVIVVQQAKDENEALRMANDTTFGLSASVFTSSLSSAMKFVRELKVGTVKVNQESTGNDVHLPFGGVGDSSHGPAEQGKAAVEFFTHWKSAYVRAVD